MKIWKAAPITLLVAMNSFAAEKIEHQVTVIAQIPSENFFVQPTGNDNWINRRAIHLAPPVSICSNENFIVFIKSWRRLPYKLGRIC
ncbi:hypothetical protein HRJ35_01050 [Shewanella oneidensis MR-1]|uniref:hypothetical protein n=1 Tax=Shewanella oneidensis TaxID=70863 RepID=UPI00000E25A8|nr:hypothetical protein [Shewanella oneidensis]MDX5998298.1 hypothetical protein [Shewanella oneidensis]QKG94724.1 hypothetical protein HRJ35_01050 [Shewanella oneidensis MR-1]